MRHRVRCLPPEDYEGYENGPVSRLTVGYTTTLRAAGTLCRQGNPCLEIAEWLIKTPFDLQKSTGLASTDGGSVEPEELDSGLQEEPAIPPKSRE